MSEEQPDEARAEDFNPSLTAFPEGLLEWAGHRKGGVRRMFSDSNGRPSGRLIKTSLLQRLRAWAEDIAAGKSDAPRIVLLVGGPGNGKTEAVEDAIRELEVSLALDGEIRAKLAPLFNPNDGSTVPRRVSVDTGELGAARSLDLVLVQDASVGDTDDSTSTPAQCLVVDLETTLAAGSSAIYLACVNRGILDDALIAAGASGRPIHRTLATIVDALGARVGAPSCWPLSKHPEIAIWPMDVESLFLAPEEHGVASPAEQALSIAVDEARWPSTGSCVAGDRCPFCRSRSLLASEPHGSSFLKVLRQYELASGKRWSFRDLFSLLSYLLAGSPPEGQDSNLSPCAWAARLQELEGTTASRMETARLTAPFLLVAAQYQHALFGQWPRLGRYGIRRELREVGLEGDQTLLGLSAFLSGAQALSVPRTLRTELSSIVQALDPAYASPDLDVDLSNQTTVKLRDIDARFSHSVREGYEFIRRYQFLSLNETSLLRRLADADDKLGSADARKKRPATAASLQVLVREFACRLVRRTLGVRNALTQGKETIEDFAHLVASNDNLAYEAAKQVESLLNENGKFTVTLNNTFGEPPPPITRRVVLETMRQKVRSFKPETSGRPRSDLRFLTVGSQTSTQAIPLTYELYRAVRELREGMLAASLPRGVVASLDAARARLAGRVVRDEEALDGAEMRIGIRDERIAIEYGTFRLRTEEES